MRDGVQAQGPDRNDRPLGHCVLGQSQRAGGPDAHSSGEHSALYLLVLRGAAEQRASGLVERRLRADRERRGHAVLRLARREDERLQHHLQEVSGEDASVLLSCGSPRDGGDRGVVRQLLPADLPLEPLHDPPNLLRREGRVSRQVRDGERASSGESLRLPHAASGADGDVVRRHAAGGFVRSVEHADLHVLLQHAPHGSPTDSAAAGQGAGGVARREAESCDEQLLDDLRSERVQRAAQRVAHGSVQGGRVPERVLRVQPEGERGPGARLDRSGVGGSAEVPPASVPSRSDKSHQ